MAVTHIIFAGNSTLTVGSTVVESALSLQLSRAANTKPIEAFNNVEPIMIVSSKGPGTGSFSYTASDGTGSSAATDWSTLITGSTSIVASNGTYPTGGTAQPVTLAKCAFAGQSQQMNAQNELICSVNFAFASGSTF